jgi:CRP/FNR family cyclic AMP-dependent transcriptional regulator
MFPGRAGCRSTPSAWVGWSWLFPPFMWAFGAVAASPVETFEFDARTVRAWCAVDMALSYEVTWRVAKVLTRRLKSMRSRLRKPS